MLEFSSSEEVHETASGYRPVQQTPSLPEEDIGTDADYVLEQMRGIGYCCQLIRDNAANLGSPADRERLYFLCVKVDLDGCHGDTIINLRYMILNMHIAPRPNPKWMLCMTMEDHKRVLDNYTFDSVLDQTFGEDTANAKFLDEHLDIFRLCGMKWPPSLGEKYAPMCLGRRIAEMAFFADHAWQPEAEIEFMDCNPSVGRITGFSRERCDKLSGLRAPWKPYLTTITSMSKFIVRISSLNKQRVVRPLEHWEVMAAIGWCLGWFRFLWRLTTLSLRSKLIASMPVSSFSVPTAIKLSFAASQADAD